MADKSDAMMLAPEFEVLVARAGMDIPAERGGELLVLFAELRAEIALLYEDLAPELEPASVYRLAEADCSA